WSGPPLLSPRRSPAGRARGRPRSTVDRRRSVVGGDRARGSPCPPRPGHASPHRRSGRSARVPGSGGLVGSWSDGAHRLSLLPYATVMTADRSRRAADLLVDCLAAEGCDFVFSVPGEETMDILDALSQQEGVRHITTRHEQGAAFMADVHGRLTGRAAVAMGTLGPGATNLVTGIADAYLDHAPMVAIADASVYLAPMPAITGQAAASKLHKEAHQVVDIVRMFEPVTKWNTRVERIRAIPEIVRKAFRVATLEKPGPTHIEIPEDIAATDIRPADGGPPPVPLTPGHAYFPEPTD